ncbi:prolyl oligopeptidase family-domain-containing protein, partial [Jimgerdemannia flammicorona]
EILLDTSFLRSTNSNIRKVLLSPDHTIFAYTIEHEGMETGSLHFKDLTGGKNVKDNVLEEVFNFVWANDNMTVYYTVPNEQLRPWQVYAHRIGTPQSHDILIFEEVDDMVFVDIVNTKDKKYITINANSLSASEVYIIDAHHDVSKGDTPPLKLIERRSSGIEYYVDHHDDHFYILTNADESGNFKLVRTPDAQPGREHWQDLIKVKSTEKIEDIDLFRSHAVVYAKREGLPVILCYDLHTLGMHEIALPETFCVVNPGANLTTKIYSTFLNERKNQEFETDTFRFSINSPFAHESTWDYNMTSQKLTPVRVHPMHRFDATRFTCERIHVNAEGGVRIPVTLMHRKGIAMDGRNPVLMRSYGAYGQSTEPEFRVEYFPLLERGWVIALAHVRGGSELGRPWYEDGKLLRKKNTFTDFIAVAEYLVKTGVTNPDMLAATGTSAGGLLVGAMCHMRPDLFRALILRVPFVDPLSAMLNPDLPLTRVEYPEWGNPTADPIVYDYIASYAPYDNVPEGRTRPSILVTAGLRDQRVACWHPLKFVARMRERDTAAGSGSDGSGIVLAKVDVDKGHFGAGRDQEQRLKESAFELAFLISQVQR